MILLTLKRFFISTTSSTTPSLFYILRSRPLEINEIKEGHLQIHVNWGQWIKSARTKCGMLEKSL